MSLNYNFAMIKDSETLHKDNAEQNKTDMLIWLTMILGVSEVTEKTAEIMFNRYCLYSKLFDLYKNLLNKEDFVRRIGLKTNASSYTKAKFMRIINDRLHRDYAL